MLSWNPIGEVPIDVVIEERRKGINESHITINCINGNEEAVVDAPPAFRVWPVVSVSLIGNPRFSTLGVNFGRQSRCDAVNAPSLRREDGLSHREPRARRKMDLGPGAVARQRTSILFEQMAMSPRLGLVVQLLRTSSSRAS